MNGGRLLWIKHTLRCFIYLFIFFGSAHIIGHYQIRKALRKSSKDKSTSKVNLEYFIISLQLRFWFFFYRTILIDRFPVSSKPLSQILKVLGVDHLTSTRLDCKISISLGFRIGKKTRAARIYQWSDLQLWAQRFINWWTRPPAQPPNEMECTG